jgi:hypothetical protein
MERPSLFYSKERIKLMEHLLENRCIPSSKTGIVQQCIPDVFVSAPGEGRQYSNNNHRSRG